jgi:hypothetical protein
MIDAVIAAITSRPFHQNSYILSHTEVDLVPAEDSR